VLSLFHVFVFVTRDYLCSTGLSVFDFFMVYQRKGMLQKRIALQSFKVEQ